MKTQKTEAQKGEVSCSKAHSKFMAELELEPQLILPPHPSLEHDYKWQTLHAFPRPASSQHNSQPSCCIPGTALLQGAIRGPTPGQGARCRVWEVCDWPPAITRPPPGHLHQSPLLPAPRHAPQEGALGFSQSGRSRRQSSWVRQVSLGWSLVPWSHGLIIHERTNNVFPACFLGFGENNRLGSTLRVAKL